MHVLWAALDPFLQQFQVFGLAPPSQGTRRLAREAGKDTGKQVRLALYLATGRPPTEAEVRRGLDLIDALQREDGASADVARKYFCLMVLNLNEFVYLD